MSIFTPEIPAEFGALDSAAVADGDPIDAHVLRETARSANRLICLGEPLMNFIWDASTDGSGDENPGAHIGFGLPYWFRVTPLIPREKMPGLTSAKLFARFKARNTEVLELQVETKRRPFNPSGNGNVLTLTGTGSDAWADLSGVLIDEGPTEMVSVWMRGVGTGTTANTGTYGTPNTGTVERVIGDNSVEVDGAAWNSTGSTLATGGHFVEFTNAAGQRVAESRAIVAVQTYAEVVSASPITLRAGSRLVVYPKFTSSLERQMIEGSTFTIYEMPRWRLINLALYAQDRTA